MKKNPTYEVRRGHVVRTEGSYARKERRDVLQTDTHEYLYTAQEKVDENKLSRSKPYENKGVQEAARRRRQYLKSCT